VEKQPDKTGLYVFLSIFGGLTGVIIGGAMLVLLSIFLCCGLPIMLGGLKPHTTIQKPVK